MQHAALFLIELFEFLSFKCQIEMSKLIFSDCSVELFGAAEMVPSSERDLPAVPTFPL